MSTGRFTAHELEFPSGEPEVGDLIAGEFRLIRPVGRGGMSVVFEAENRRRERLAIKLMRSDLAEREDLVRRFIREGSTAAAIRHPGIVDVSEVGWCGDGGPPYLVMELLEGCSVADDLAFHGPLSPTRVRDIAVQVLDAVACAHACGVLHRDLKPGNVFLVPGEAHESVKVLDFGISKTSGDESGITQVGQVLGTPAYMAPEQAEGCAEVDHRVDVYSVGVMMFEILSGVRPFPDDPSAPLVDPPRLLDLAPAVPRALAAIVERAMRSDRGQRWSTARVMRDRLAALALDDGDADLLIALAPDASTTTTEAASPWELAVEQGQGGGTDPTVVVSRRRAAARIASPPEPSRHHPASHSTWRVPVAALLMSIVVGFALVAAVA